MKVIDVSQYNGVINWKKVSKHCDGAIIRVGYRGYGSASLVKDKRLGYNLTNASLNRIPLGVYFVTQAITEKEAKEEARFTVDLVKKYKLSYPIFIDSENANGGKGRADAGKLTLIVTEHGDQVAEKIDQLTRRGSTFLKGVGSYSKRDKQVVMCACNKKQMHMVQKAVKEVDPMAFMVTMESSEVRGEGFKPH